MKQFVNDGYVCLRSAFSPELAARCRRLAADQLGIDLATPSSWTDPVLRGVPEGEVFNEAAHSSPLREAVAQLVRPDVWCHRPHLGAFVVRFPSRIDPGDPGWHIDSSFQPEGQSRWYVNYRSKHRALLVHAASWPPRGSRPRFVAQPSIALAKAFILTGPTEGLSPVASTIWLSLDRGRAGTGSI